MGLPTEQDRNRITANAQSVVQGDSNPLGSNASVFGTCAKPRKPQTQISLNTVTESLRIDGKGEDAGRTTLVPTQVLNMHPTKGAACHSAAITVALC